MQRIRESIALIAELVRTSAMTRRGMLTALVMLLAVPLIAWSSASSINSMFNAPLRWIPRDSESRQDFNWFLDLFGSHEMVLVSWAGCEVDDPRLGEIESLLREAEQRRRDAGKPAMINQVLSGNALLQQLVDPPVRLPREAALGRLQGVVVGPDGKTSCVLVEVTDYGAANRREVITLITDVVTRTVGLDERDLMLVGPPIDGMAIDDESVRSIIAYSMPSIVVSFILCWICLRSLWLSIPVLMVGSFGQALMLAMVGWSGSTMNAILIVLPALVFVLSVSAGVHLVNYFIEEVASGSADAAPQRAMSKAVGPCLLAAVTTAIGLASLCVSVVQPVHDFGLLGSLGLLICMALLFLVTPAFMVIWSRMPWMNRFVAKPAARSSKVYQHVAGWVWRYSFAIRVICLTGMVVLGSGLVWLRTSVDVVSLLSPENRAVRDFYWFEKNIGPLIPVEIVVHFDHDCKLETLERLAIVMLVQQEIDSIEMLGGDVSVATFLPPFSGSGRLRSTARRSVIRSQLEKNRSKFVDAKYLADTPDGEAWRVSARIFGRTDFDHGSFLVDLQAKVDNVLSKFAEAGYTGISAKCTGVTAVVHGVQKSLLQDLFNSFLMALLLVAIVMMLALRSVLCGLLAMIPNVFPTLVLFGRMGWVDEPVDIGSVMTASVGLGIAVDGTFHFLKWFKNSLQEGSTRSEAISVSFQHCGRALVQTTAICACGLFIFSFSGFLPVRHFSLMMLMMMSTALVGDLILLPALLAGRLGAVLSRKYQPTNLPAREDFVAPRAGQPQA